MGITIEKMCNMWALGIESGNGPLVGDDPMHKQYRGCNVFFNGKTIYSYGHHFPMAYILGPNLVWFNGDRFSNSTNHQSELRSAIANKAPEAKVIIVPASALDGARVSYESILPVDVHGERWEYTLNTATTPPSDMNSALTELRKVYAGEAGYVERERPIDAGWGDALTAWMGDTTSYPDVVGTVRRDGSAQLVRFSNGEYRWHSARHWLGDAVFTAERTLVPARRRDASGNWEYGRASTERVYFISSFDRQERRPLYFLSQLPGPAETVDAAIESLAPDSVKAAREMGRTVIRQGDMFAIPMDATTRQLRKMGATFERRKVTVELTRHAQERVAQRDALALVRETMPAYPERTYWTVGQDRDAFNAIYKQWEADCDKWADELVARYHAANPELEPLSRWAWQSTLAFKPTQWHKVRNVEASALYGTAHTATEVATLPDGRQFARGLMYHDPAVIGQSRAADHRRQPLGRQWHLVARNTVPVSGTGSGRRG